MSNNIITKYDFSLYKVLKVSHKKVGHLSIKEQEFLEWFIGFSEGDGSFLINKNLPIFVINQADLVLLRKIRTTLGFGSVSVFKQNETTYARYRVSGQENILRLIAIFNGNIQLQKVHQRFSQWVDFYNKVYLSRVLNSKSSEKNITVKSCRSSQDLTLLTGWLSGFFDAEGGFYAGLSQNISYTYGYRLRLKTYVDQKLEYEIMDQIRKLFKVKNITIRNKEQALYQVEISSIESLTIAINYFEKYKILGKKHIVYAIWKKLVNLYLTRQHLKIESQTKIKKKVMKIQELNSQFKREKTVLFDQN